MNLNLLQSDNRRFRGSGGVSRNNRCAGFQPAFRDSATGTVYLSCFRNGLPAPVHLLDGLPDEVVLARDAGGRITAVRHSIIAGFVCAEAFYTREEAAQRIES